MNTSINTLTHVLFPHTIAPANISQKEGKKRWTTASKAFFFFFAAGRHWGVARCPTPHRTTLHNHTAKYHLTRLQQLHSNPAHPAHVQSRQASKSPPKPQRYQPTLTDWWDSAAWHHHRRRETPVCWAFDIQGKLIGEEVQRKRLRSCLGCSCRKKQFILCVGWIGQVWAKWISVLKALCRGTVLHH